MKGRKPALAVSVCALPFRVSRKRDEQEVSAMTQNDPVRQSMRPVHPQIPGLSLPWALALLVPGSISLQLVAVPTVLSVYAEDLAWEFVTEQWVWFRLSSKLLYASQLYLFAALAVYGVWCIVGVAQWIIRRVRR